MNDDHNLRLLVVSETCPANDIAADVLRWVALIGGLGLCALGILTSVDFN